MNLNQQIFLLLMCIGSIGYSQEPYYTQSSEFLNANSHWAFGDHAGLDFSAGSPLPFQTSMYSYEGCAAVSDPQTGKFLFYSNGEQCWNASHSVMPNGDSLKGNSRYSSTRIPSYSGQIPSSSQGVCIVPVIGSEDQYYLFSLAGATIANRILDDGALFYSIIDMKLDNGAGDIVASKKNIALTHDTLSEAIASVPGNNCDIWLLVLPTHKPELYAYRISRDGIDTVPVVSNLGFQLLQYGAMWSINVSPDRSKLAIIGPTEGFVGEFDPSTGQFTNRIDLNFTIRGGGVAFSPDNSKLYLAGGGDINQCDISVFTATAINMSWQSISLSAGSYTYNAFRLYNDTIYFVNNGSRSNMIHRINSPNLSGTACGLEENAIQVTLNGTTNLALGGVPGNDVVLPISKDTVFTKIDTLICSDIGVNIEAGSVHPDYSYTWNTGETTSQISVANGQGVYTYWVDYGDGCYQYRDSFIITTEDVFTTITVNGFELGTTGGPFAGYQWFLNGNPIPGATSDKYTVLENGDYQVVATGEHGCVYTSDIYKVTNHTVSIEDVSALANQIHIYPNPADIEVYIKSPVKVNVELMDMSGRIIKSYKDANVLFIDDLARGIYLLNIIDQNGLLLKVDKLVKSN